MHEVIRHNLLTLLEYGAFDTVNGEKIKDAQTIEIKTMSNHKWRKLVAAAEEMRILPYIAHAAFALNGAKNLAPILNESCSDPKKNVVMADYDTSNAQLYNHWTSKRLEEIHEEEMNAADLSEETLMLLDLIIDNADAIITKDVNIEGVIAMGCYIKQKRENIDFDKLEEWLARVGMTKMASLLGSMLVVCMHFKAEDIPFVNKIYKNAENLFMSSFTKVTTKHSAPTSTRMDFAMIETVSHRFMSAISLVTDVEE